MTDGTVPTLNIPGSEASTPDAAESSHKFDDCMKLAQFWADSYQRRRDVEWKVSLGLWAVILTGITQADKLHPWFGWGLILGSGFVWVGYVSLWLIPIQVKNQRDKVLSYYYADWGRRAGNFPALSKFEGKVAPSYELGYEQSKKPLILEGIKSWDWMVSYWSVAFHALTTALLLVALNVTLANYRPEPTKPNSALATTANSACVLTAYERISIVLRSQSSRCPANRRWKACPVVSDCDKSPYGQVALQRWPLRYLVHGLRTSRRPGV
jgi:hypothetical protein